MTGVQTCALPICFPVTITQAYQAETQRISAVQAGMTPEQIQDIVMGTIAAAVDAGDLSAGAPQMREAPQMEPAEQVQQEVSPTNWS